MHKHYRWMVLAICWLAGVFAGMDANLFSVMLQPIISEITDNVATNNVIHFGSYALSSFLLGWMAGGILLGMASDRLGRVKILALSIFLYATFTGITAFAQSVTGLAFCRFGTGFGVGGTMVSIAIFLAETWRSSSRAVALAILVASYQVGVLLSGAICHSLPDWRTAFALGALPVVVAFFVMACFREPSLKVNAQKQVPHLNNHLHRKHLWVGGIIFGSLLIGYWASLTWIPTWMQGLLGNQAAGHEKNFAIMIHGFCAIAGCLVAGPCSDSFGRRPIILLSYLGALGVSLWMFLAHDTFSELLYVYFGALGFFIGMAQAVMYIYLPELFTTQVRAASVGLCLNGGRLITAIAVLSMGVIIKLFGGYVGALTIFSTIYLLGIFLLKFAPETKSSELPI